MKPEREQIHSDKLDSTILMLIENKPGIRPVNILDALKLADLNSHIYKEKIFYHLKTLERAGKVFCEKKRGTTRYYVRTETQDWV